VANPKAVILFAAVLPQFVNRQAGHVPGQILLLSLVSFDHPGPHSTKGPLASTVQHGWPGPRSGCSWSAEAVAWR
jgi:hypothetical protein